jgi:hypothetical protein
MGTSRKKWIGYHLRTTSLPAIVMEFFQCFATMCQPMERNRRSGRHGAKRVRQNSVSLSHPARRNGFLYARSELYQGCKDTTRIFRPSTPHSILASPRRAGSTISSSLACFRFNLEDRR